MTTEYTLQTHRADSPRPRHFHGHYLHNLHDRGGTPGLECTSGMFSGVHQNLGKVTVLEFSIRAPVETRDCPTSDICLVIFLQLCRFFFEHVDGDFLPGHARESRLEHILHPFLIRL